MSTISPQKQCGTYDVEARFDNSILLGSVHTRSLISYALRRHESSKQIDKYSLVLSIRKILMGTPNLLQTSTQKFWNIETIQKRSSL